MLLGPTIIRRCISCSKPIGQTTIASGNTFGAEFWTDGKMDAPMLPDQLALVSCPHCGTPVWINELEILGEVPRRKLNDAFPDAKMEYETFSLDYFGILANKRRFEIIVSKPKTRAKERYLRIRAWWSGNDQRRTGKKKPPLSPLETFNLVSLASLLNESRKKDVLIKAEIMRELGLFEYALSLLDKIEDPELEATAAQIRQLAAKRDPYVRALETS